MDLMNTLQLLLFWSFVLSGSRGCDCARNTNNQAFKVNKTLTFESKTLSRKHMLLNINRYPRVKASLDKSALRDSKCLKCIDCMNQAIIASESRLENARKGRETQEVKDKYEKKYYLKRNNEIYRFKRRATDDKKEIEQGRAFLATVKKYTRNKKVYALEVKTTTTSENDSGDTCHYYSVKKTLACDDEQRMSRSKRTNKKTSNKMKKYSATTTENVRTSTDKIEYKKRRDIENSQGPESYMLSMEDFY